MSEWSNGKRKILTKRNPDSPLDHAPVVGGAELSLLELVRTFDSKFVQAIVCTKACPEFIRMANETDAEIYYARIPRLKGIGSLVGLICGVTDIQVFLAGFHDCGIWR